MLTTILLTIALPVGRIDTRVREFLLPNGLLCITYVDSSAPVVSVSAYYRIGSYHDLPGKTGLSHMLEHMTFKRTDIYRPGDFDRILDSVGANNNGFTSTFYTGYYEEFSSDRWELGLKLEAARMSRCQFLESDFRSEHQVVAEERRLQDNRPTSVFWERLDAVVFLANPQRNPTIGWPDDVARFTVEDVRDWYHRYYNPANAILVVAGLIDPQNVKNKIEKCFGRIRGKQTPLFDAYSLEPEQFGERRITIQQRVSQPMLVIAFHSPGFRDSTEIVGDVVAAVLGRGRLSRLYRRLVTDRGLCTWTSCWNSVQRDPGAIYIAAQAKIVSDI
ncbi:MAG: pitrilysin family protein, partial [candidate division WOR-3 bacterium]